MKNENCKLQKAKPFGHSAIVERREYGKSDVVQIQIHRQGSRGVVERAARLMGGFQEIVSVDSYSEEEWIRVFGWGTEHGRN